MRLYGKMAGVIYRRNIRSLNHLRPTSIREQKTWCNFTFDANHFPWAYLNPTLPFAESYRMTH